MSGSLVAGLLLLMSAGPVVESTRHEAESAQHAGGEDHLAFTWLRTARKISRSWSASKDTPALGLRIFPRPVYVAGGELAIASLSSRDWTLRTGFAGLIELEFDAPTNGVNSGPIPASDGRILWRGAYAYFLSFSFDSWANRQCSGCELELSLRYRHESEHYTGSNEGGDGIDVSNQPYVGDDFIADVAWSQRLGDWYLAERVIGMWFLPNRSSYSAGVAGEAHVRWMPWRWPDPFVSVYGEYLAGDDLRGRRFPSAYRIRGLLGFALPSTIGDVMLFATAEVGHRHGVRALTEEASVGFGVRLTLGSSRWVESAVPKATADR